MSNTTAAMSSSSSLPYNPAVGDFLNMYIIPAINVLGLLLNLVSSCVYANKKCNMKNANMSRCLLVNSLSASAFCLIGAFNFLSVICKSSNRPCRHDMPRYSLITTIFTNYVLTFLASVLSMFSLLIDITVSVERLLTITKTTATTNEGKKPSLVYSFLLWVMFLACFIYHVPFGLAKKVVYSDQIVYSEQLRDFIIEKHYYIAVTEFGVSAHGKMLMLALSFLRYVILLIPLVLVNVILSVVLHRKMAAKRNLLRHQQQQQQHHKDPEFRVTLMVIWMSILSFVGLTPSAVYFLSITFLARDKDAFNFYLYIFSNTMVFLYHSVYFFLYYKFNKIFRNSFKSLLKYNK